jgi:hypothetical protein
MGRKRTFSGLHGQWQLRGLDANVSIPAHFGRHVRGDREQAGMFRLVYEAAAAVFLLQAVLIPLLLVVFGAAWFRQTSRLAAMKRLVGGEGKRKEKRLSALLEAVPKLQPLTCPPCGSPMVLEEQSARCIGCDSLAALPDDYRATRNLRRRLPRLATAAIRHWRAARILTATPVRWLLWLMILSPPLLFVIVLIGAGTYRDTFLDRAIDSIGEGWALALTLFALAAFILWMMIFGLLAALSKELRRKLPAFPDFRWTIAEPEFATCRSCGGGIGFGAGTLACLCSYCTVPNFRAEQARRERSSSEEDQARIRWSLFGAMDIIEKFTATIFFAMAILLGVFALFALWSAVAGE